MEKNIEISPYECVNCQLAKINPFYQVINALLLPYKIVPYPLALQNPNRACVQFQVPEDVRNKIYAEGGALQVQVRCCKIDGVGYEHSWPKVGALQFNDQLIQEYKQPENPNAKKRKDEPMNITTLVRTGNNSIEVIQHGDQSTYSAMVFLVKYKDTKSIINNTRTQHYLPEIVCREKLKKYFQQGDGDEV